MAFIGKTLMTVTSNEDDAGPAPVMVPLKTEGRQPGRKHFTPPGKEKFFCQRDRVTLAVIDDADGIPGNRVYAQEISDPKTRRIFYKVLEFPIDIDKTFAAPCAIGSPEYLADIREKNALALAAKESGEVQVEEKKAEVSGALAKMLAKKAEKKGA